MHCENKAYPLFSPFFNNVMRVNMTEISEEERKKILESSPVGTWVLMLSVGGGMVVAWLFLYYGVFLSRGIIN